jgi:hypothetical protein
VLFPVITFRITSQISIIQARRTTPRLSSPTPLFRRCAASHTHDGPAKRLPKNMVFMSRKLSRAWTRTPFFPMIVPNPVRLLSSVQWCGQWRNADRLD